MEQIVTAPRFTCQGFTRNPSAPCHNTEDLVKTTYDHLGTTEKKHLCPECRARILVGPNQAWFHD